MDTKKQTFLSFFERAILSTGVFVLFSSVSVFAAHPDRDGAKESPCAVLQRFGGDVQVLDPTRTQILEIADHAGIPCGSWITVTKGFAEFSHRQGFNLHLGENTFVEIFDHNAKEKTGDDHVILYKGSVYAKVHAGQQELRIMTTNARIKTQLGTAFVVYNEKSQETQATALENSIIFENRFNVAHPIRLGPGEASYLNLNHLRLMPSTPRSVSVADLKGHLDVLSLSKEEMKTALRSVYHRGERQLASDLREKKIKKDPKRSPASYARHPSGADDRKAHNAWTERLVGDRGFSERLLYPKQFHGKPRPARVKVEEVSIGNRGPASEDAEKRRLIEELSKIQVD